MTLSAPTRPGHQPAGALPGRLPGPGGAERVQEAGAARAHPGPHPLPGAGDGPTCEPGAVGIRRALARSLLFVGD